MMDQEEIIKLYGLSARSATIVRKMKVTDEERLAKLDLQKACNEKNVGDKTISQLALAKLIAKIKLGDIL